MADLNALIAQGAQFQAPVDPFAQYGKMQQLQQGLQANQLNQMKMEEYQRNLQEQNALRGLDPAAADYLAQVKKVNPKLGFEFEKAANEAANLKLTGTKTQAEIAEGKRKLLDASLRNMASNPSDENIIAHTQDYALNPLFKDELPSIQANAKRLLAMTPEQRKAVLSGAGATAGDLSTAESARLGRLTTERGQDIGATTAYRGQDIGAATAAEGQKVTMRGQDIGASTAAAGHQVSMRGQDIGASTATRGQNLTARTAASRLAFDQGKFAWEKANPGKTIKEITQADGSTQVVAIDNRTGMATQVMMAGVPSAAPTGASRGSVGVTDGRVGPATPLVGAANKPMTESQGNATAFGMRMKDSNEALKNLENKGVKNTGVIGGTVGGVVGLVPFVGDKLSAGVDNIYNVLPQVLGGYSPEQQQVLNGRINFVTALLRKESGAAISPGEFSTAEKLYFPRPGDDATVVKQKQNARELAIKAMKVQAGPGAKSIDETSAGGGEWRVIP
jgi:hypothetical protein